MKTIRTTFGNKTIAAENNQLLSSHIFKLLHEHRARLIDGLLQNDLQYYVDFKFQKKLNPVQIKAVRYGLQALSESPVSAQHYASVIEDARKYDHMILTNAIFYHEIHATILENCNQRELFGREFKVITTPVEH
jgi:hypothetical protein